MSRRFKIECILKPHFVIVNIENNLQLYSIKNRSLDNTCSNSHFKIIDYLKIIFYFLKEINLLNCIRERVKHIGFSNKMRFNILKLRPLFDKSIEKYEEFYFYCLNDIIGLYFK